jgi:hypothetical protein
LKGLIYMSESDPEIRKEHVIGPGTEKEVEFNTAAIGVLINNGFQRVTYGNLSQQWRRDTNLVFIKPETTPEEVQEMINRGGL